MSRTRMAPHVICVLGIIVFLWSFSARPGVYYGSISGSVLIVPADDSQDYESYHVHFQSKTEPAWEWTLPHNFRYDRMDLTINDKTQATVFFPSLTCKHGAEEVAFSKALLKRLITADSDADPNTITPEKSDQLFGFIISAGQGTLPPPQHHPYYSGSPYGMNFTHFLLGGGDLTSLSGLTAMVVGILLELVRTARNKDGGRVAARQRVAYKLSPVPIAVLINYSILLLGIYLNRFGGAIDIGTSLCSTTWTLGMLLIPVSIGYSFLRRFGTRIAQWDFFGVCLSLLLYFVTLLRFKMPLL
jgi:hypothetical protein